MNSGDTSVPPGPARGIVAISPLEKEIACRRWQNAWRPGWATLGIALALSLSLAGRAKARQAPQADSADTRVASATPEAAKMVRTNDDSQTPEPMALAQKLARLLLH